MVVKTRPNNLLALCPNCHSLHHKGVVPATSHRAWKRILLALNEAFDQRVIDILLALHKFVDGLILSGDGAPTCAALVASDPA
jgi:hypothetical protein